MCKRGKCKGIPLGEGFQGSKKEMEEKESMIAQLMRELDARNVEIKDLTVQLSKLKTPTRRVTDAFAKEVNKERERGLK